MGPTWWECRGVWRALCWDTSSATFLPSIELEGRAVEEGRKEPVITEKATFSEKQKTPLVFLHYCLEVTLFW